MIHAGFFMTKACQSLTGGLFFEEKQEGKPESRAGNQNAE